ncbi:MAG: hypothetical protein N2662_01060 [Bacteroidales bacterium]|nr:hypothetical protein [Bacteroidales bacterium]
MAKYFLFSCVLLVISSKGQSYQQFSEGVVSESLAGYMATGYGIWQISGNMAGMCEIASPVFSLYYRQRYLLTELSDKAFLFVYPSGWVNLGFSYLVFGNKSYREESMAIGTSRKFGDDFSCGLKFSRYSTYMLGKNHQHVLYNADAGVIYRFSEKLSVGAYIQSLVPYKYRQGMVNERFILMGLGGSYSVHSMVVFMSEIQLSGFPNYSWICGLKIIPSEKINILTGLHISNSSVYFFSFGFLYDFRTYEIGLALTQHSQLGITPSFQLSYRLQRKEKKH